MIACLRGCLLAKTANTVVVECHGVGYEVAVPLTVIESLPAIGDSVFLLTEFVVRPEVQTLFGFINERERTIFRRLLKVSGIGSKTALAMLSAMTADELLGALAAEDVGRLSRIPGIGQKSADRLIVDFRGSSLLAEAKPAANDNEEVEQALLALGYKKSEIQKALSSLNYSHEDSIAERVRAALRLLSKRS